jgi:hypothetical protein
MAQSVSQSPFLKKGAVLAAYGHSGADLCGSMSAAGESRRSIRSPSVGTATWVRNPVSRWHWNVAAPASPSPVPAADHPAPWPGAAAVRMEPWERLAE